MANESLTTDIISALRTYADENRIAFANKSHPTKMEIIGVTVPNLKKVLKEVKKQTKAFDNENKMALTKALINTNIFECQQLAFEYIGNDKKLLNTMTEKDIDDMAHNMDNWLSVDYFAALIVGYAWRNGIISINKVKSYQISEDFWTRRIAIVATVALNQKARGGDGDASQTLEICELAIDDHQEMINKALSWALRELAKRLPEPAIEFIERHKQRLHKKVYREVNNKIQTGNKN